MRPARARRPAGMSTRALAVNRSTCRCSVSSRFATACCSTWLPNIRCSPPASSPGSRSTAKPAPSTGSSPCTGSVCSTGSAGASPPAAKPGTTPSATPARRSSPPDAASTGPRRPSSAPARCAWRPARGSRTSSESMGSSSAYSARHAATQNGSWCAGGPNGAAPLSSTTSPDPTVTASGVKANTRSPSSSNTTPAPNPCDASSTS